MTALVVDEHLAESDDASISGLASSLTLNVLRRLDGPRRGQVVQFLADAQLIENDAEGEGGSAVLDLYGANLRGAKLRNAIIDDTFFGGADLAGADLRGAILDRADFAASNLRRADSRTPGCRTRAGRASRTRA